jgi:hypothetical protein
MSWLQIILALISALPGLITDIENLIDAITGKTAEEQETAKMQLTRAIKTQDPAIIQATISKLK